MYFFPCRFILRRNSKAEDGIVIDTSLESFVLLNQFLEPSGPITSLISIRFVLVCLEVIGIKFLSNILFGGNIICNVLFFYHIT